jgi:hypothetical protein
MRALYLLALIFLVGCSTYGGKPRKAGTVFMQAQWEYVSEEKKPDPDAMKRSASNQYPCQLNEASCHMEYLPLSFVTPRFPPKALAKNTEGSCIVLYEISETGVVENPEILSCEPTGFFENVTMQSLIKAKHLPRVVAGSAMRVNDAKVKYDYIIGIE